MSDFRKKKNGRMVPVLLLILVVFSTGCEDDESKIQIEKGGHYSVDIPAEKGDVLHVKWNADGEMQWQLTDDNDTRVASQPKNTLCVDREQEIELQQNATYTLRFDNLDTKTVVLHLEWEIR